MRSFVLLIAMMALFVATPILAEDPPIEPVGEDAETEMDEPPELDAAAEAKAELDKIDTSKDGKADLAEITAYMKAEFYNEEAIAEENLSAEQVAEKSQEDGKEYLTELDTNKDGFLDLDEIKKHYEYTDEDEAMGEGEEGGDEGEAEEGDEPEEEAE